MTHRKRKLELKQFPGDAGAFTIVETVQRPLFVVSDDVEARKLMRAMEGEERRDESGE